MLPSETMIWQPEFTDKTLSRKPGAVQVISQIDKLEYVVKVQRNQSNPTMFNKIVVFFQ
ncbi:hypothetical protein H000_03616 [Escherichia coli UMEA 3899-1]|nr:hypothetical protein H000_03616 [Escherichia coli UMEA 3899-1]